MAFFRCDVMSESLGMATSVLVTMPDTGDLAAAPVVYLLHGLTDNCTGWLRYTQAETPGPHPWGYSDRSRSAAQLLYRYGLRPQVFHLH